MGRWEPNAYERLQKAAMELFQEHGYDRTTVEEIAARAGLTERTFFRHFNDKREVLFSGSKQLEKLIVEAIAAASPTTAPLDVVVGALEATTPMFEERRPLARKRHALVSAHAELCERELIKMATLASAIAESLHQRGIPTPNASLIAEAGIALFRNAFQRWLDDGKKHDFTHHLRATLAELRLFTSTTPATATESPLAAETPPAPAPTANKPSVTPRRKPARTRR
jgi:AcrR family transcriptional regulator